MRTPMPRIPVKALGQAPEMHKVWRDKKQKVTKIVIDPWASLAQNGWNADVRDPAVRFAKWPDW
jgi:hypothetical protein